MLILTIITGIVFFGSIFWLSMMESDDQRTLLPMMLLLLSAVVIWSIGYRNGRDYQYERNGPPKNRAFYSPPGTPTATIINDTLYLNLKLRAQ